jgi:hypothetical protein
MPSRYDIIPATEETVRSVANNLRPRDYDDMQSYLKDLDYGERVMNSFRRSKHCWVVTIDGIPAAVFGVFENPEQFINSVGHPWFRGTHRMKGHETAFLRRGRKVLRQLLSSYYLELRNAVDAGASDTIRWLEWMGFTVDDDLIYLNFSGDTPMRRYYIRRT